MAAAPAYAAFQELRRPPTDAETLKLFVPADAAAEEVESFIDHHPVVADLRADPNLHESRPHMRMPSAFRPSNFTGGTLLGPGRLTVAPFEWKDREGRESIQIFHVGKDVCGHPGIVHGGMIATMLDEGLARCCFAALPHHVGVTATLTVNYKAPAKADSYLVLRAETTKVEGRKAWVKGRIETLAGEGKQPTVLAEADGLFVSPKQAAVSHLDSREHTARYLANARQMMERVYPTS
jgi:3'-phosphoadenosine 5'-phosphosulfate synthase